MIADGQRTFSAEEWCGATGDDLQRFLAHLLQERERSETGFFLREDVRRAFERFVKPQSKEERKRLNGTLRERINLTEEVIFRDAGACMVIREEPGTRRAYLLPVNGERIRLLDERQFLSLREGMVLGREVPERFVFGINFRPFRIFPAETGTIADIGNGPLRVAKLLEEELLADPQRVIGHVLAFIGNRSINGKPLLFLKAPEDVPVLRRQLRRVLAFLGSRPDGEETERVLDDLELLGFTQGWGRRVGRARETLEILDGLLRDPDAERFIELLQRLPLMRRVLLASVHGWFAQSNVLGRPDTGGQIVYVLDQARAIESYLRSVWRESGVDAEPHVVILSRLIPEADGTTCDQPRERVEGSKNCWIVRVPFRSPDGEVLPHWISRFQVWPYLDRYAQEAYGRIMDELEGEAPDLVVGNYSDGNMVASVLGREWRAPIAVIAHALEKTKYLLSDLYWRDQEQDYHFSIHFLSDILAANSADFIITSSYQEIAGTRSEMGQYESYEVFTLPERYRVVSGVNIKSARFVINPPGVNTDTYHPYATEEGVPDELEDEIASLVFGDDNVDEGIRGRFADPDKPIVFTMARMDRIKNLAGLVRVFGRQKALRDTANLLILSGVTRLEESTDLEEREQIGRIERAIEQYDLQGSMRWLPGRLGQHRVPHFYRFVAARRGVFVQPALFEAFGLTVLEAMATGLPIVATRFGGPASIIEDRVSGFLVDPNRGSEVEKAILALILEKTASGEDLWGAVSRAAIRRVHEHFSWPGHARRLAVSYGLYGLWNAIFPERRLVRRSYVEALHHLLFSRLVDESWPG